MEIVGDGCLRHGGCWRGGCRGGCRRGQIIRRFPEGHPLSGRQETDLVSTFRVREVPGNAHHGISNSDRQAAARTRAGPLGDPRLRGGVGPLLLDLAARLVRRTAAAEMPLLGAGAILAHGSLTKMLNGHDRRSRQRTRLPEESQGLGERVVVVRLAVDAFRALSLIVPAHIHRRPSNTHDPLALFLATDLTDGDDFELVPARGAEDPRGRPRGHGGKRSGTPG